LECPGIKPVSRETCHKVDCITSEKLLMDGGGAGKSEISNKIDRLTPAGGFPDSEDGAGDEDDDDDEDVPAAGASDSKDQYRWRSEEMTACSASCLGGKNVFTSTVFTAIDTVTSVPSSDANRNTGVGD
jgi:hypothetical protein